MLLSKLEYVHSKVKILHLDTLSDVFINELEHNTLGMPVIDDENERRE